MKLNENMKTEPPRLAKRFLSWYCRPELLEDLEGDLNEYFERNSKTKGRAKARLIYTLDVFKFLRSYTVRKPDFLNLFTQRNMIGSYIKISGRSIVRNKLFSFINIAGLAVSMSVGLLLIGLLSDMTAYDKFHKNYERIYRIKTEYEEDKNDFASTSLLAGKLIKESITGIEDVAVAYREFGGDMKVDDKTVPLFGLWANESFLKVFSFNMTSGDPATALVNPYSIVLTEKSAKKLFGVGDALGKTVRSPDKSGEQEFVVTGIIEDVPTFSHVKFDLLASLSTREEMKKTDRYEMAWNNIWNAYVYLLLPEGADLENLQHNLNTVSAEQNKTIKNATVNLSLQPLSEIALGEDLNNSIGTVMVSSNVWMIGILSVIVILSACFNYTNLSIARSLRRSREVGIRKVVGALRSHVIAQFVVEAVIIALASMCLSFVLFVLLKPLFLALDNQYTDMLVLDLSPALILYFLLFAVCVGIAAGIVPALYFASVNAIKVLKNISAVRGLGNMTVRQALIVIQFTISLTFIASTIIGYKHYKQILASDLGFDTENVLNIALAGNKSGLLKKELLEMPEVTDVSTSHMITSVGNYYGTNLKYTDPKDSVNTHYNIIDEHYLPLHGHKLLAGRNFTAQTDSAAESEVIVNERVLKRFNIGGQDPQKAIGEIVEVDRKKLQIIGVMKDYHYGKSIDQEMREVIFRYSAQSNGYLNAKVISTEWPATLSKIEAAWKKIDPVHPLSATFYDDEIERSYKDFSSRIKIIGYLSFLAICIASIGLLGMVIFTTETRIKEISIRKVLGASVGNLIYLLSRNFIYLLVISMFIAVPLTYSFFAKYALSYYAESAPSALAELTAGLFAVMGLALAMICAQTLKVARSNPAEVLKNE
jgi:putative ABC transport system permease protein